MASLERGLSENRYTGAGKPSGISCSTRTRLLGLSFLRHDPNKYEMTIADRINSVMVKILFFTTSTLRFFLVMDLIIAGLNFFSPHL